MEDDKGNMPAIVVNPNGTAIMIFEQDETSLTRHYDGSSWGAAEQLTVSSRKLVMNEEGLAISMWTRFDMFATRYDGSAWSQVALVSDPSSFDDQSTGFSDGYSTPTTLECAMNADGNAVAVWQYNSALWVGRLE